MHTYMHIYIYIHIYLYTYIYIYVCRGFRSNHRAILGMTFPHSQPNGLFPYKFRSKLTFEKFLPERVSKKLKPVLQDHPRRKRAFGAAARGSLPTEGALRHHSAHSCKCMHVYVYV